MARFLQAFGLVLTLAYFCALLFIFNGRVTEIMLMEPNEIGDLLAGVFGPLAILWLILGFFQQGIELRQNTQALTLQARELTELVCAAKNSLQFESRKFEPHLSLKLVDPDGERTRRRKNHFDEDKALSLMVSNQGGTAFEVRAESSNGIIIHQLSDEAAFIPQGQAVSFVVFVEKNHDFNETTIKISYEDALGNLKIKSYEMHYSERFNAQGECPYRLSHIHTATSQKQ